MQFIKNFWFWNNINNFKRRNGRYYKKITFFKDSDLLIKSISETNENQQKEQKGGFLGYVVSFFRIYVTSKFDKE